MKLSLALMLMIAATAVGADDLFLIDIVSHPDDVLLGIAQPMVGPRGVVEGWFTTSVFADVHYLGNDPLPIVYGSYPGYWSSLFSISAEVVDETGTLLDRCEPSSFANDVVMGAPHLQPGWSESRDIPVCVPGPGVYEVRVVVQETADVFTNLQGEVLSLWTGRSVSDPVTIRITEPEGVDKQAYEAFNQNPLGNAKRYGELLRRFPTSTYAGYALAKGHGGLPYSKPPDQSLIEALGSGDYLREHPAITIFLEKPRVVDGTVVRRETVRTEPRIRAHVELLSEFIALHPGFSLRHRLEMMLGFDSLALGDADAAESHWRWVSKHSPDGPFAESARGHLEDLEALRAKDLIEKP